MTKLFQVLCIGFCFLFSGGLTVYANSEKSNSCDGYKGKLLNACHGVVHPKRNGPRGVGANILIHETEIADFISEYKYDDGNKEHSIFFVVENKKSVVDYIKDLINKVKGE